MENYVKVGIIDNEIEALLLETILKEREIPYLFRSYHDTAYDGLFQTQKGWGYVSTLEKYAGVVEQILKEIREKATFEA